MKKYVFRVLLDIEVEAYDMGDAQEVVEDAFGEGETCGLRINDFEITDREQLG